MTTLSELVAADDERKAILELVADNSIMAPQAESAGFGADFVMGFGNEMDQLIPGRESPMLPPDTIGADLGSFAPELLASAFAPARGLVGM
ncbi:unnamed protein product, partial [marine sediment metagenome]